MTGTISVQKSPQNLNAFHAHVDHLIVKAWATPDMLAHLEAMTEGAKQLAEEIIKTGDAASEFLGNGENAVGQNSIAAYVINFAWSERAKFFLILWRDMLFEQQKAEILLEDDSVLKLDVQRLQEASKVTLQKAFQELKAFPEAQLGCIRNSKKGLNGQIAEWKLQANPWSTYRTQIEAIPKQCESLLSQFKELQIAAATFEDMRKTAKDTIAACHKEIELTRKIADSAVIFIEEHIKPEDYESYESVYRTN
jgi:hypothetical protein